jgi:hypothetical protein
MGFKPIVNDVQNATFVVWKFWLDEPPANKSDYSLISSCELRQLKFAAGESDFAMNRGIPLISIVSVLNIYVASNASLDFDKFKNISDIYSSRIYQSAIMEIMKNFFSRFSTVERMILRFMLRQGIKYRYYVNF